MRYIKLFLLIIAVALCSCISDREKANSNDLFVGGISNRRLLLNGTEGVPSTFNIRANYDWSIVDYTGFSCSPSSGARSLGNENITITATPLQSNNSGDTIYLSPLNFRLLSTRFVGIEAYQLPQIVVDRKRVAINAVENATSTFTFRTMCQVEDIEIVRSNDNFSAKITRSENANNGYTRHTITITSHKSNISTESYELGEINFKVDGIPQERLSVKVVQAAALSFDRSMVLLPGHIGGENSFIVNSDYDLEVKYESDKFSVSKIEGKTYRVTALTENNTEEQSLLGEIKVSLNGMPESAISIGVYQRRATASQTIMVYFLGTALKTYYQENMNKMLKALNKDIQGDARILAAFTDTESKVTIYEMRHDKLMGLGVKEFVKQIDLTTPYDEEHLELILNNMKQLSPAEKYALMVGSHGLAWVPRWTSYSLSKHLAKLGLTPKTLWKRDEMAEMTRHIGDNDNTRYDIGEIATAINACNLKFDYILFDACFMSNIESAYELRNATKYIIGSPCEIMGSGFPYDKVTPYMLTEGGASYDLDKICSEYVKYYKTEALTKSGCIAMTSTDELEALAVAMKAVNEAGIKSNFTLDNVQYYEGQATHSFYDLGDMVNQSCADEDAAKAFKEQLDKCVTSRYHTDEFYSAYGSGNTYYHKINYYSGISTSAMVDHYSYDWKETSWYKATH